MLNFWEKDFDEAIEKHIKFLKDNLEYQDVYSNKFSKILQNMEILQTEENEEKKMKIMKMIKKTHLMMIKIMTMMIKKMKIKMKKQKLKG